MNTEEKLCARLAETVSALIPAIPLSKESQQPGSMVKKMTASPSEMAAPTGGAWTPGPWRAGRSGTVVCDTPIQEIGGSDSVNYYGGHLVAESVAPQNVAIIAAAPDREKLVALENLADEMTSWPEQSVVWVWGHKLRAALGMGGEG